MDILLTNTDFTGKFLIHLYRVDSTNDYAKEYMSKTNPKDGTVILADEQYAGRGQAGAVWEAEAQKNLTFSIIYDTSWLEAQAQFNLNMAVALGLRQAIAEMLPGKPVSVKWPNDIYVNDSKIAGILIENTIQGEHLSKSIVGIGVNVNQENFDGFKATSLFLEKKSAADKQEVLKNILQKIENFFNELKKGDTLFLKNNYYDNLYQMNAWCDYEDDNGKFFGKIIGVNEYGKLVVQTENVVREYGMKEVRFL